MTNKIQENYFYNLDNSKNVKIIWKKYDKANILEVGIEYPTTIVDLDRLSGIPLTKDWLIKFGFEKANGFDDTTYFNKNGIHLYFWGDDIIGWFEYENEIKIDYIHQLQNLYFSLTNTELNYDKI